MARILLADDDSAMRGFLDRALQTAGHQVTVAEDGAEAYKTLQDDKTFDLLLTDIVMPGMDGVELAHKAHKLRPDLKIMFMTGFSAVAMEQMNATDDKAVKDAKLLSKPFHLNDLVARVEEILGEKP